MQTKEQASISKAQCKPGPMILHTNAHSTAGCIMSHHGCCTAYCKGLLLNELGIHKFICY